MRFLVNPWHLQALPYRWIGFLRCADGTRCTGALVSDRHVLTAGANELEWAQRLLHYHNTANGCTHCKRLHKAASMGYALHACLA